MRPRSSVALVERGSSRMRGSAVGILGALTALGPLTIDMYLPALPRIARDLHSASATVGLTLTATLLGFALGQLLVGPISDRVGRRRPILYGVALHIGASIMCALAPNIAALCAFRLIQGIAASAAGVVALAIVRDVANGRAFVVMMSRLLLIMGAAPVLAPTLGSQILRWTQWRGVFLVLTLISVVLLALTAFVLPETLPVHRRLEGGIRANGKAYGVLVRDRTFLGLALVAGLTMCAVFGYLAAASFVLQAQYRLSAQQFAIVFGLGSGFLIAGTQLNPHFVARWTSARVLGCTLAVGAVAGSALLVVAASSFGGLPGLLTPLWVVLGSIGVALPNSPMLALSGHGDIAGTAAALLGAAQFGVAGAVGPIFTVVGVSALSMAAVIAGGLGLTLAVYMLVVQPWKLTLLDGTEVGQSFHAAY